MALSDKNILITPSIGAAADPKIIFSGADAITSPQNVIMQVYPTNNGTLSIDGSVGQMFSVNSNMTGTIFSVNDISGIPSIEVLDTGLVKIAQYNGNVGVGLSSPAYKLHSATNIGTGSTGNNGYIGIRRSSDGAEIGSLNTDGTNLVVNTGLALAFQTAGTERMRMHNSGGFSIGNTTDSGAGNLNVAGTITIATTPTATTHATNKAYVDAANLQAIAFSIASSW
jgi:hypothetical protein